ncbi:hypothetical protein ACFL6M_06600, partial [Candidatus Eisenbacteria bacterium]
IEMEDTAPTITRLMIDPQGFMWVLTGRGAHAQRDGVMATYDVFDRQGHLVRQTEVACEGNGLSDDLFFMGDDRLLLVTGAYEASMALRGTPLNLDDGEPAPMEAICLEIIR